MKNRNYLYRLNTKGITLVELMLILGILAIILQTMFLIFSLGNKAFNVSKDKGIIQKEVRTAAGLIVKEIKNAKELSKEKFMGEDSFFSLSLEKKDGHNALCRTSYLSKEQYEKFYIGQAITELLFLPLEGDNMIQVKIKAEEKGQEYELSFQILLENIEYVDIPERGISKIFYTKYQ